MKTARRMAVLRKPPPAPPEQPPEGGETLLQVLPGETLTDTRGAGDMADDGQPQAIRD